MSSLWVSPHSGGLGSLALCLDPGLLIHLGHHVGEVDGVVWRWLAGVAVAGALM